MTVKLILDRTIEKLKIEDDKTFHWAETIYLKKWWDQASDEQQADLLRLIHVR